MNTLSSKASFRFDGEIKSFTDKEKVRELSTNKAALGSPGSSDGKLSVCNAGDLGWEDALEKGKATYSSILAWRIP